MNKSETTAIPIIPSLTLWQPWATLLIGGQKRIETRGWPLFGKLPRTLAIHAAAKKDKASLALCQQEPFRSSLALLGYHDAEDLPFGCVLGVVTVVRVYRFGPDVPMPEWPERCFGDFSHGRYGWVCENPRELVTHAPAKGAQKLWGWRPPGELVFSASVGTY